ncbi:glycosyltransferase family 2 protein [Halpernia frigidisoli]|uniref:Glycosyl transferase family 2 n=1 Tax=Halpernia frigidisoli TaxID=1125876 RepID=A0A1I3GLC1_9FLAO|nr:glycosyltransferase family 2 protein [Halpernia frigidisoli]SFI24266.1 Glycosyl transferase family 2 [Halpernia frigidisoli]
MKKTVSIIIPNYNRANLIVETLESIVAQTYKNWECLIIDDGSKDNSIEVINNFIAVDHRFKLYERDAKSPKGANSCRNIGAKKAKGDYIIYFDSDDLMLENHLEIKINTIKSHNYDFVIAKTEYFNSPEDAYPINYRSLFSLPITADNFIQKKINWLTLDPIIKAETAKAIQFTEKNSSAEEYNYFVKLVLQTENAIALDVVLSLRRFHEDSFQFGKEIDEKQRLINYFFYNWDTLKEVEKNPNCSQKSKIYLLENCINLLKNIKLPVPVLLFHKTICEIKGYQFSTLPYLLVNKLKYK